MNGSQNKPSLLRKVTKTGCLPNIGDETGLKLKYLDINVLHLSTAPSPYIRVVSWNKDDLTLFTQE